MSLTACCLVGIRSTKDGGAVKHQATRLTDDQLHDIYAKALDGDDAASHTRRKFTAFSMTLCTRGESEQYQLRFSDFELVTVAGKECLKFDPTAAFKNYQGGLKDRKSMVSH